MEYIKNIDFELENCGMELVGEEIELSHKGYNWNSNLKTPFLDLVHYRIYYIEEGTAILETTEGELLLEKGYVYYLPTNSIKSSRCETKMYHYFIHFSVPTVQCFFLDTSNIKVKSTPLLIELINTICMLQDKNSLENYLKIGGCLRLILGMMFEGRECMDSDVFKFHLVLQYIDSHLDENISIRQLADMMNLSSVYFSTSFKKALKITPVKYIAQKKLMLAKQLLLNTNLSVKEISYRCGFQEPYYFSNWFISLTQISPTNYRKSNLKVSG